MQEEKLFVKWDYAYFLKIIKAAMMLYGLEKDYFGYGTRVLKRKDGKYKICGFDEVYVETLQELATDFDSINKDQMQDIIYDFVEEMLNVKMN